MKVKVDRLDSFIADLKAGKVEVPEELDELLDKALAAVDARTAISTEKPTAKALQAAVVRAVEHAPMTPANLISEIKLQFEKATRVEVQSAMLRMLDAGEIILTKERLVIKKPTKSSVSKSLL